MSRSAFNNVLTMLAVVGVFAAFDVLGHRDTAYFWIKLGAAATLSAVCLLLTRDRDAFDTFAAAGAGLFALFAVAMTAGDRTNPNWWPFFIAFTATTAVLVLLTRKRQATLLAISAIVGFRLVVFVVVSLVHR